MAKKNGLSAMMQHYLDVKNKYPDCVVFYRLGDFYEMFFEDAVEISKVLDLTLTGRDCGLEKRAPMCGIPFHSADSYIAKLIEKGYKVAICEQLTDKIDKNLVERDVVRIVTPGILMDENMLQSEKNNYILALRITESEKYLKIGIAYCDVSTGEFVIEEINEEIQRAIQELDAILMRVSPAEIFCNENGIKYLEKLNCIKDKAISYIGRYSDEKYDTKIINELLIKQFGENIYEHFNIEKNSNSAFVAGILVDYITATQKRGLSHINDIKECSEKMIMQLDNATRRNLELTETIRDHKKRGSLLSILDETSTCMGGRLIRNWISTPLQDENEINLRLDCIEELNSNLITREDIKHILSKISDIERIAGRISYGNFNPKDAISLKYTSKLLPELKSCLLNLKSNKIVNFVENFDDLNDISKLLEDSISDDAPTLLKEGNVIKYGYNKTLDDYKNAKTMATTWLAELEAKERELTGIKNLKISYNKVFGYFIEVSKSQIQYVPYRYQRKQTIANGERYITEDLKIIEEKLQKANENSLNLEIELFNQIRNYLLNNLRRIQKISQIIAELDCLLSGSFVAVKNNYCKPKISNSFNHIKIQGGRHPVVEVINKTTQFVPNDTYINESTDKTLIITGPNMAGKSTYMRQVALIVLMAHAGFFVPADSAEICITDKIFTRIGASDDVAFGQSTFMVEMVEVANILNNATNKSLALLDEVGRGTSTFDGLSIAWAVMEYISEKMNMKTLFSTHYHELTELENILDGVKNYRVTVKEYNDEVIFLRKIVRGGTNKSFGIAVAKLAGLPKFVIDKAKQISQTLETTELNKHIVKSPMIEDSYENKLKEIINELKMVDINNLSPLQAFDMIVDLVKKTQ